MKNFIINESTEEEAKSVLKGLIEYNSSKVSLLQEPPFITINRVIKKPNADGNVLAGINSKLNGWKCLHIEILWVEEEFRRCGYGTVLLNEVERAAKNLGSSLIRLETYDFQAKDFYLKHGFEIFGVLDNCPNGHKFYFLKKQI